jgi:tetratricopeptide (TPR) repeat protein
LNDAVQLAKDGFALYEKLGAHDAAGYSWNVYAMCLLASPGKNTAATNALKLGVSHCHRWSNYRAEGLCLFNRARAHHQGERLDEAIRDANSALKILDSIDAAEALPAAELVSGLKALARGDRQAAVSRFAQCRKLAAHAVDLYALDLPA